MRHLIERLVEATVVLGLVYLLAGCSTLSGFGSDVQWLGDLEAPAKQAAQN